MQKQYWNRENTAKSYEMLGRFSKEIDFVLIGGWAVYMYTNIQRSEDVDIAIGYGSLDYFRKFGIEEYEGLNIKYSVIDGATVDLFIEEYADVDLPIPVRDILSDYTTINGIKVVSKEMLMLLKLHGYFRLDEIKHGKDIIDVLTLLFYGEIDLNIVKTHMAKYKIGKRKSTDAILEYLDIGRRFWEYITETEREYANLREKYRKEIRQLFYEP